MDKYNEFSKFNTESYFIAYLDILGYKEKVGKGDAKLAEIIDDLLNKAEQIAKDAEKHTRYYVDKIEIKAFSDNIIVCTKKHWDTLFMMVGLFQNYMIENGYFIRGALCYSDLYFGDRFLFGKGIIMAHEIESKLSIYPRILLHSSYKKAVIDLENDDIIFDALTAVAGMLPMYLYDSDGYMFLNYLHIAYVMQEKMDEISLDKMLEVHRTKINYAIRECEERCYSPNVMQKFLWCMEYHNRFCAENGYEKYIISIQ